ncbi:MAG: recombination protein RecR [Acidimicrobiales bacterium]|nr:recombination protein RecR [Acidimicrobiales bacterium]
MTGLYAGPIQDLIEELGRLPGIGPKSAQRIAFHLLKVSDREAGRLARAVTELKARITFCTRCFNVAEVRTEGGAECAICTDPRRDNHVLCVVEEARDLVAVERTGEFKGRYHVLGGAINHLEGIGPDQLRVRELLLRLQADPVQELIVCTNPNLEGDATALYLVRLLADVDITVTRLASGLPVGSDLEYADELTLGRAIEGRRPLGA